MAKGFTSGGVDFDDLFDPDVIGDGPAAPFLTSGGVSLKYAALAYGTKRADVGFRNSSGVDVSNLWAAKGTAVYAEISDQNITEVEAGSTSSGYRLRADGVAERFSTDATTPIPGEWIVAGSGDDYECMATIVSGSALAGGSSATGTWLSMGSTRQWSIVQNIVGIKTTTLLVEIRRIGAGSSMTSATITLSAEYAG